MRILIGSERKIMDFCQERLSDRAKNSMIRLYGLPGYEILRK